VLGLVQASDPDIIELIGRQKLTRLYAGEMKPEGQPETQQGGEVQVVEKYRSTYGAVALFGHWHVKVLRPVPSSMYLKLPAHWTASKVSKQIWVIVGDCPKEPATVQVSAWTEVGG
jgi:hypothetical protein